MDQAQQSRIQISGLSSPFSSRTTPASSLSRTNSDASQYGSASMTSLPTSVSATSVSPISPSQQYSPTNSPNQTRHPSGGSGSHSLQSQHQIIQGNTVLIKSKCERRWRQADPKVWQRLQLQPCLLHSCTSAHTRQPLV